MRRGVVAVGLVAACLMGPVTPVWADGLGDAYVEDATPTAEAAVTLTSGGQEPVSRPAQGGSATAARCTSEPARLAPGEVPLDVDGAPRPSSGAGEWRVRRCVNASGGMASFDTVFVLAAVAVDPLLLAQQARERLPLEAPRLATSPDAGQVQLVGVPTWLWVSGGWAPRTAVASVPGVSVTVLAEPVQVSWDMGDGGRLVCDGPGRAFDRRLPEAAQSTDCSYAYSESSAGQPGERFMVTGTVTWRVSWSAAGVAGGGDLGEVTRSAAVPLRVAEGQALIGGRG